jgi:DNA end-binding protein Ku
MPRALWKGAISFGLVHIPVALYPAARVHRVDFDWLDRRNMKPVGYRRINKSTGREVPKDDIVRGVQVEQERYVVLTDAEIRSANPERTQTVEILAFVDPKEIATPFFDTPYVLAPVARGEKVYLLLREALRRSGRAGVALVVLQSKQHLAAVMPLGDALLLQTLRWHDELRTLHGIELPGPPRGKLAPGARELQMAQQLIDEMSAHWKPEDYVDRTREEIMALVQQKMDHGEIRRVEQPQVAAEATGTGAQIVDLTELLKRSLAGSGRASDRRGTPARKAAVKRTARTTHAATKSRKRA